MSYRQPFPHNPIFPGEALTDQLPPQCRGVMASFMPSPVQIIRIRREDAGLCRGTLPCRGVPLPEQTTSITLQHRWNYPPSWRHGPSLW